jgi:hypothetical protein
MLSRPWLGVSVLLPLPPPSPLVEAPEVATAEGLAARKSRPGQKELELKLEVTATCSI